MTLIKISTAALAYHFLRKAPSDVLPGGISQYQHLAGPVLSHSGGGLGGVGQGGTVGGGGGREEEGQSKQACGGD